MIGEEKYYGAISADSPFFFENYQKLQDEEQTGWHAESQIPPSWSVVHSVPWTYAGTNERRLRVAGWKIHLSATPENAEKILSAAIRCCVPRGTVFKFLRSPNQLFQANSKYANRSSSGKFVTIYPSGDDELDQIVAALMETIGDEKGPYILSDIRYGGSPIYFRYGGFVPIAEQNTEGKNIECIPNVDGFLVEDHRAPFL